MLIYVPYILKGLNQYSDHEADLKREREISTHGRGQVKTEHREIINQIFVWTIRGRDIVVMGTLVNLCMTRE